jgi:hypothetical protein
MTNLPDEIKEKYDQHVASKDATKNERKQDREIDSPNIAVVCIDNQQSQKSLKNSLLRITLHRLF